ncbi:helix-turn-helix transcriptional regulator [Mammaliicoccus sciuri]|uniref:helix-turn-helix transcriptional regulator n=1 Tax=Mammaliicoccus sciuri TaxID=1296 RepID=UPI001FB3AC1C|nr:helix-turn-helix transcriptional regulator [Mammaliicoccus sciuri]MCJ0965372.1 helix-turn-helix transcriptional regulator [Mammaliicoccus sciuri]
MRNFKSALRDELKKQKISVVELSRMTNIPENKISEFVRNISYRITISESLIIARALEKDIYEMCGLEYLNLK